MIVLRANVSRKENKIRFVLRMNRENGSKNERRIKFLRLRFTQPSGVKRSDWTFHSEEKKRVCKFENWIWELSRDILITCSLRINQIRLYFWTLKINLSFLFPFALQNPCWDTCIVYVRASNAGQGASNRTSKRVPWNFHARCLRTELPLHLEAATRCWCTPWK